jgi:hypothetical protein
MVNIKIQCLIVLLLIILSAVQVWATCEDPETASGQKDISEYRRGKIIHHYADGRAKTVDSVTVWNRDAKGLCFSIETMSAHFRECYLGGRAEAINNNEYSYKQAKCDVLIKLTKNRARVKITGPRGDYCVADDLGEGSACGMNATIDSATYRKVNKR